MTELMILYINGVTVSYNNCRFDSVNLLLAVYS